MNEPQKLKLIAGNFQIEYEGSLQDLVKNLPAVLDTLTNKMNTLGALPVNANQNNSSPTVSGTSKKINSTTNAIATRIGVVTCSDLLTAASAFYFFVQGKLEFSRKELMSEMKTAKGFYKPTFKGSNLDRAFKKLIADKILNECGKDVYSLHPSSISQIEAKIATH